MMIKTGLGFPSLFFAADVFVGDGALDVPYYGLHRTYCVFVGADSISALWRKRREQLCALQNDSNVAGIVVGTGVPDGPFVINPHCINW